MKRGIAVLLSLSALMVVGYFTVSKWAIRHETLVFHDPARDNRTPDFKAADERVAYEVTKEIMNTNELSQAGYDKAIRQFGEQGTVELISTIGYYAMVGIFLKSFDVRPPDGSTPLK